MVTRHAWVSNAWFQEAFYDFRNKGGSLHRDSLNYVHVFKNKKQASTASNVL